jgi:trypsin
MIKILIVFAVASLGQADINRFVVGGKNADISSVPYQAALLAFPKFCGGSIISKSYILTAAHCIKFPENPEHYKIRVGSSSRFKGGTVIGVAKITIHPNYNNPKLSNDIALLQLKTPIKEFGSKIQSIALATPDQKLEAGSLAILSGWGLLSHEGNHPPTLQKAVVPLVSLEECRAKWKTGGITEQMLCAGIGKGPCSGK